MGYILVSGSMLVTSGDTLQFFSLSFANFANIFSCGFILCFSLLV